MTRAFNLRALSLALAGVAVVVSAAPAVAQTDDRASAIHVSYADLDINTTAGARTLMTRIDQAADRACGERPDIRQLKQRSDFERCRKAAVTGAVAAVDSPRLTAMITHGTVDVASR